MWAGDVSSRRKYSKKEENVTKTDSFKTCFIYTFTYAGLGERRHEEDTQLKLAVLKTCFIYCYI